VWFALICFMSCINLAQRTKGCTHGHYGLCNSAHLTAVTAGSWPVHSRPSAPAVDTERNRSSVNGLSVDWTPFCGHAAVCRVPKPLVCWMKAIGSRRLASDLTPTGHNTNRSQKLNPDLLLIYEYHLQRGGLCCVHTSP
jgi:hypothetical protein